MSVLAPDDVEVTDDDLAVLVSDDVVRRRDPLWRTLVYKIVPPTLFFAVVIGIWELFSEVLLTPSRRFLLPSPQSVLSVGFLTWVNFEPILEAAWLTTRVVIVGLAISSVLGMTLAILMSQAKWIERSVYPYAVVLQTVPILAIVPLVGFLFGFDFKSRVLICVIISIFPIITNTLFGLQSVDPTHHDLFTLTHASRRTTLRKLELPAALPSIFAGMRIASGLAVIGAVVGDFFFLQGQPGLGALILLYRSRLQSEQMYTAVIVASLLGIAAFVAVGAVRDRTIGHWHESANRGESN